MEGLFFAGKPARLGATLRAPYVMVVLFSLGARFGVGGEPLFPTPPERVNELNSPLIDWKPWISPDGLEMFFSSDREDVTTMYHIYYTTRATELDPWSPPVRVLEVDQPPRQHDPYLSGDRLKMYFTSWRVGGPASDKALWSITRQDTSSPWDSATQTQLPVLNGDASNEGIWISEDELTIYFGKAVTTTYDIYMATRASANDDFSPPVPVVELNDTSHDRFPCLTPDELAVFFSSDRAGSNGVDLYLAVRDSTTDPFGTPVNVSQINSAQNDYKPYYHAPTEMLYFCSDRPGGAGKQDIYRVRALFPPYLYFRNRTTDSAVVATLPRSAAIGDLEGDDDLDLFFSEQVETAQLWVNDGNAVFTDGASVAGLALAGLGEVSKSVFWDFDGNGDVDLYINQFADNMHMVNQGDATFVDEARLNGLTGTSQGNSAVPIDYDRDGHLDLYLGQGGWDTSQRHLLLRNEGTGTFRDVTTEAGLGGSYAGGGALVADYDLDGDSDLYIVHNGANALYSNNGDGTFTELTGIGADDSGLANGADVGDIDGDGDFDIFIANDNGPVKMLRNNLRPSGSLTFSDMTGLAGVGAITDNATDASFGDVDNDGDLDLYIAVHDFDGIWEDHFFLNDGTGRFTDSTPDVGLDDSAYRAGEGCGLADLDSDGDLDIVVSCQDYAIVENVSQGLGHWLEVELVGTISNRDAIGARAELKSFPSQNVQARERQSAKPRGTQDSPWLHFGIGDDNGPVRVAVWWPRGLYEIFRIDPIDRHVTLVEGSGVSPLLGAGQWMQYQ